MIISLCGSMSVLPVLQEIGLQLETMGHTAIVPIDEAKGSIDYNRDDPQGRAEGKKKYGFIEEHLRNIEKSDAILVVNMKKREIENYVGANTFLEIGFAHYKQKKIFFWNPLPEQPYIMDELLAFDINVISGDLMLIA